MFFIGTVTIVLMADSTTTTSEYLKHPELYMETLVLLVENCLFKVPRKPLEEESVVFRDMFRLPQPKNEMIEGRDDTRPVVLHGISKDEFECLLKALLCRQHGQNKGLVLHFTSQWISVLKLSTMWECTSLRTAAISWLGSSSATLGDVEKVALAMQYDIKGWLLPSLLALAQ
ncbi:hypothetical protein M404DRAFT_556551, partial [Pisolithus tinctorius Marx 270]